MAVMMFGARQLHDGVHPVYIRRAGDNGPEPRPIWRASARNTGGWHSRSRLRCDWRTLWWAIWKVKLGWSCVSWAPRSASGAGPSASRLSERPLRLRFLSRTQSIVPSGQSVTLKDGQVFRIGPMRDTSCCVLAVAGGFDLPFRFGSLSTYVPGRFGGLDGRLIADGDEIALADRAEGGDRENLRLDGQYEDTKGSAIRVVLGPQDDYFTADAVETFLSTPYTISPESNRMGCGSAGPAFSTPRATTSLPTALQPVPFRCLEPGCPSC